MILYRDILNETEVGFHGANIFFDGNCESFAYALNKLFGYQMMILWNKKEDWFYHMFCYKNGKFIDYNGIQSKYKFMKNMKLIDNAGYGSIRLKNCVLVKDEDKVNKYLDECFSRSVYDKAIEFIKKNKKLYKV